MFGREPSLDTCIEVLRDNDYIILEGDDAKKNLSELEEIYGEDHQGCGELAEREGKDRC